MTRSTLPSAFWLLASLPLLAGCERAQSLAATHLTAGTQNTVPMATEVPPDVVRVPDIPIPPNSKIVRDDTTILGADDSWTGQVVITTSYTPPQMTEYYRVEMPKLGWSETAVLRARRTAITFTRGDRIALVRIAPNGEVDIVVAPAIPAATAPAVPAAPPPTRSPAPAVRR
jgi:hypothetical protein